MPSMSPRWERKIPLACLAVTALLFPLFLNGFFTQLPLTNSAIGVAESVFFLALVMCLLWGNLLYQLARYGYFVRKAAHAEPARADLEQCYDSAKPPVITVLIPSYREELHVLRQTILSAALLDYPQRRIAVLIDNPPNVSGSDLQELRATREMIEHLNRAFAALAQPLQRECDRFLDLGEAADLKAESQRLARLYEAAAEHLDAHEGFILSLVAEQKD